MKKIIEFIIGKDRYKELHEDYSKALETNVALAVDNDILRQKNEKLKQELSVAERTRDLFEQQKAHALELLYVANQRNTQDLTEK